MATTATALTTKVQSGSPYELDSNQVIHASSALLKHMKKNAKEKAKTSNKQNLLTGEDGEDGQTDETPIWLNITTKKHIIDQKRLKPAKIALPHALNASATTTICLITADPQRTYKDIVASPAFPADLRTRITRVVGVKKVKAKYNQYEAQRRLLSEHDIFLADDRIITRLPKLLGKTFYKATTKRPVPVSMQGPALRSDGKRIARAKDDGAAKENISPQKLAAEIKKTLAAALVSLSPSTLTSVRIGLAGWPAQKIAENIEAVANELITRFVPQKWKNVRALHIKGPETAALPIWLTDELWVDEGDVIAEGPDENKAITGSEIPNVGKKRKAIDNVEEEPKSEKTKKVKKVKKEEKAKNAETAVVPRSNDDNLDKEIVLRKNSLKRQKAEAVASVGDEVPKVEKVGTVGKKKKKSTTATVEA